MTGTGYLQPTRCFVEPEYLFTHAARAGTCRVAWTGRAGDGQMFPKAEGGTIARAIARHAAEAFRAVASKPGKPNPKLAAKFQAL